MIKQLNLENLGKLIKVERQRRNLTQADVARGIKNISGTEVKQGTISEWESGTTNPGFLGIYNLCRFWEMTVDELLGVKKDPTLHIETTEQERETMHSLLDDCQQESGEDNLLQSKLHFLEQRLKAFFSRAQRQ